MAPIQLSPSVFLHEPLIESAGTDLGNGPRLVILATWGFAQDGHIAKYVANYREIFPNAAILVAKSFLRHMFWVPAAREELVPAVSVIRRALGEEGSDAETPSSRPRLLLHFFSNTGLATACNLFDVYATATSTKFPLHATILDSSPGVRYEYATVAAALMQGVRRGQWLQRLVSLPLAHSLSSGLWIWVRVVGGQDWVDYWSQTVNDPKQVLETGRSYIYSQADPLVQSRLIEWHAKDAQDRGFVVLNQVDFGDSAHVSHARADPTRYWRIVKETWEGISDN